MKKIPTICLILLLLSSFIYIIYIKYNSKHNYSLIGTYTNDVYLPEKYIMFTQDKFNLFNRNGVITKSGSYQIIDDTIICLNNKGSNEYLFHTKNKLYKIEASTLVIYVKISETPHYIKIEDPQYSSE